jgi:imidazolonepropionase-like amidohydrolase
LISDERALHRKEKYSMNRTSAVLIIVRLAMILALFLPWTGGLTIAGAAAASIRYLAIGLTMAWADVVLILVITVMLLAYPLVGLPAALRNNETRKNHILIVLAISLIALILLPLQFAREVMFESLPALSWGYWLYLSGWLAGAFLEWRARRPAFAFAAAPVALFAVVTFWHAPFPQTIALVNGTLIDGTGAAPVRDAVVVVQNDRILAAGSRASVTVPPGAQIIDVRGGTVLPGFIDAHVHSGYDPGKLQAWAADGVTTVCDLSEPVYVMFSVKRELFASYPRFASVIAVGHFLTVENGYPMSYHDHPSLIVTSPEDARLKTQYLIDQGADMIKIAFFDSTSSLTPDEVRAIVDVAHRNDRLVRVHQGGPRDIEAVLPTGIDVLEHNYSEVSDETLQAMVDQNVSWVPTLAVIGRMNGSNTINRFVRMGGRVAMGTDAGFLMPPGLSMSEINALKNSGLSPIEIIVAATQNSAYVCGILDQAGTVEPGKTADILVIAGDPLQDLGALAETQLVIHRGKLIR